MPNRARVPDLSLIKQTSLIPDATCSLFTHAKRLVYTHGLVGVQASESDSDAKSQRPKEARLVMPSQYSCSTELVSINKAFFQD